MWHNLNIIAFTNLFSEDVTLIVRNVRKIEMPPW